MRLCASPFLFHLSIAVLFIFLAADNAEFHPTERNALVSIRELVNSTTGGLHSLWTGPPCNQNQSRWVGIACANDHVVRLVLEHMSLTGSLAPNCLLNLPFLTKVSFKNNYIFGSLPKLHPLRHLQWVSFAENRFYGTIPFDYVWIPNLTTFDLHGNSVTGKIPPFSQKSLTGFNVSNNHLEGEIPATAALQRFGEDSFGHNPELCGGPLTKQPCSAPSSCASPHRSDRQGRPTSKKWVICILVAFAASIALLVPTVCCVLLSRRTRQTRHHGQEEQEDKRGASMADRSEGTWRRGDDLSNYRDAELDFFDSKRAVFDLHDLLASSAQVMGQGRTGSTFKSMLECGLVVAVKRLKVDGNVTAKKDFVQHMQRLAIYKHPNLAEMVGFCYSKTQKLVIYEYVPGESLYERLHGILMLEDRGPGRVPLRWKTRLGIIKGVARALAFMHQNLALPHTNLKSTNILLSPDHAEPMLSHYGFEPMIPPRLAVECFSAARSPEFAQEKKFTYKTDVWCFGVVLMEVITGRAPAEFPAPSWSAKTVSVSLTEWVRSVVTQEWSTDILDLETLPDVNQHASMLRLVEIALDCTDPIPGNRPEMSQVVMMIEEIEQDEGIQEGDEENQGEDEREREQGGVHKQYQTSSRSLDLPYGSF